MFEFFLRAAWDKTEVKRDVISSYFVMLQISLTKFEHFTKLEMVLPKVLVN